MLVTALTDRSSAQVVNASTAKNVVFASVSCPNLPTSLALLNRITLFVVIVSMDTELKSLK